MHVAWEEHPRVQAALSDFEQGIRARYPDATFLVLTGGEPDGVYLSVTVDVEDTNEVLDVIMDRMLEVQNEEYLPVYVIPRRPTPVEPAAFTSEREEEPAIVGGQAAV